MTGLRPLVLGALALLLTACAAKVPFKPTEMVAVPARSSAELAGAGFSQGPPLLVRQSALFEFHGMRVPMAGMMRLDPSKREARVVGMDDMGVKLYDISVDATKASANFLMPELAKYPMFADAVGKSVRRIFLEPAPAPTDALERERESYRLTRKTGRGTFTFLFGGAGVRLLEKSGRGAGEKWRVRYYEWRDYQGIPFPGGIVADDDRAGYRLTLWTESVERSDE